MKNRGIYLVANKPSEQLCKNLVYTIRRTGCRLPIAVIPYDGRALTDPDLLAETRILPPSGFPSHSRDRVRDLAARLDACPEGFLRRFLALDGPFDEFIYADNDIVAISNWEPLLDHLQDNDIVHQDMEWTTDGRFNFTDPSPVRSEFGREAMLHAMNGGFFAMAKSTPLADLIPRALDWMEQHRGAIKMHDQTLLHIALLLGDLRVTNLCRPPHNYAGPWAGDYGNLFDLIATITSGKPTLHLHYAGGCIDRHGPMGELLASYATKEERYQLQTRAFVRLATGLETAQRTFRRAKRKWKRLRAGR